ncbi:hypothetical protein CSC30_3546 [Pseudomonas aeruginosa]|nr:hypothetical protein CSC30_3546 [Pseudomonas aeruginosa]
MDGCAAHCHAAANTMAEYHKLAKAELLAQSLKTPAGFVLDKTRW